MSKAAGKFTFYLNIILNIIQLTNSFIDSSSKEKVSFIINLTRYVQMIEIYY